MVSLLILILTLQTIFFHFAQTIEQSSSTNIFNSSEQVSTTISVPMQSILLPCKAMVSSIDPQMVMWYKLTKFGQSTLTVGKHLVTKDPRFSVIYYSVGTVNSPASWDLQISNVRLSDAADYQCHVQLNQTRQSRRSTVKLIVQDILIDIQPLNIHVTQGDPAQYSCSFSGEHRVQREDIVWLKDGQAIEADENRVITITELVNMTLTTLQIVACRTSDRGSYRCTDGRYGQSREAKLYLQDMSEQLFLRSFSSSSSVSNYSFSHRTVLSFFVFIYCFFLFENEIFLIFIG